MIFVVAKFSVIPEHADAWPDVAADFTRATRAETGCLWFNWSRSLEDSNEYVLLAAFRDQQAGREHVGGQHFRVAQQVLPHYLRETPRVVNVTIAQEGWSPLNELSVS